MADKPAEFLDIMTRVAPAGEGQSGFSKRLGPTEQCFSPRDLVNEFQWGATRRASAHIAECEFCARWVDNYSRQPAEYLRKAAAAQASTGWFANVLGRHPRPQLDPAIALLLAGDRVINVAEPGALLPEVSFPVVAGLSQEMCSRIDLSSLQLDGLIASCDATLEQPKRAGEWWDQYPVIHFTGVRPANKVHLDLSKSFGLTDKVRVTGRFKNEAEQFFLGQAMITLKKG